MEKQDHWQRIYADKRPTNLSWFKKHLQKSLELIDHARLKQEAQIIDVGCGTSTLVDDLLDRGFTNLTILDLSANALYSTKERLGEKADLIT